MRSKIGTKTRLAAHLLALLLLILMLVYIPPRVTPGLRTVRPATTERRTVRETPAPLRPSATTTGQDLPADPAATLDRVHTSPKRQVVPTEKLRPPVPADQTAQVDALSGTTSAPIPAAPLRPAVPEPIRPPEEAGVLPEPIPVPTETPAAPAEIPAEPADVMPPPPADVASEPTPTAEPAPAPEPEEPPVSQPDESGALVVAEAPPVRAVQLLPNARLEVLGDAVYWLDPKYDLQQELSAIPEVGTLVLLTPLPGYRATEFPHLKTEVLPADPTDLTIDAAEHFLHLTTNNRSPVVVAMLPGARGAAFFKGVYFLRNRNIPLDDVIRELEPELQEAGGAREDIIHRLIRFDQARVG